MLKDNENIPFLDDGPLTTSEPQGFAPDQMVRCEECLRANPPTRLNCFYCAAALPVSEKTAGLLKPSLRPLGNWELGYNNIFLPQSSEPANEVLNEAAKLLKLNPTELSRLLAGRTAIPLARTETFEEASLVDNRLKTLGFQTAIVSDADLALRESPPVRLRSLSIDENGLTPKHIVESDESQIPWSQLVLVVTGRLSTKRVEVNERKGKRGENEIQDASEFFADDAAVDLYCENPAAKFRILANGFDFSGLRQKKLVVAENYALLLNLIREKALQAEFDDSYNSCRQALDVVWPCGQQTESRGWRREGLGKYSIGAVTESSNENQFTRYSRLRYFLKTKAKLGGDHDEDNA